MADTFLLLFVAASLLCLTFLWLAGRWRQFAWALEGQAALLRKQGRDCEHRLQLLEAHVIDYVLSVGAEGTAEIAEMNQLLEQLEELWNEVKRLLKKKDFPSLHAASKLLEYDYTEFEKARGPFDRRSFPPADWSERFEQLLQSVGERVTLASDQANAINLKKRRTRRASTISGLAEIGIRKVVEHIRERAKSESCATRPLH